MAKKISVKQRNESLKKLNGWKKTRGKDSIEKDFIFKDFQSAFSWMTKIAFVAEKMDHHPEWFNVYNKVQVKLTTHDAGGITQLDIDLANIMNKTSKYWLFRGHPYCAIEPNTLTIKHFIFTNMSG